MCLYNVECSSHIIDDPLHLPRENIISLFLSFFFPCVRLLHEIVTLEDVDVSVTCLISSFFCVDVNSVFDGSSSDRYRENSFYHGTRIIA